MRKVLYNLLQEAQSAVPSDRIYQFGSVDDEPMKPFIIYRLAGRLDNLTSRRTIGRERVEVWVHDVPGSYALIEDTLSRIEDRFLAVLHDSYGGQTISQIDYDSRSTDLDDSGFRSICKMSSFMSVGRG